MKNLDTLYEAYQNYKKLCIVDNDTARFLRAYMNVKDRDSEDVSAVFSVCHIEQDWVEAIEVGLPFFEKAIKEERQFIRNDGEVLPIEKIRKTSKASIQDLAKHANYITHEAPEDAETEVLPDKMLMIQKESDFAIYENRVLYAGLMYLKDFVASRLVEIKETTNTYLVKQHINKLIDMGARKINIDLKFDESRVNDPLLTEKNQEKDVIDRLDEILTNILALLKTPLMREVSKVEMVSRPISKTNILKMNRNFRESLACFEYIANYQGKGFSIEHVEKSLIPYTKQMNEAYTENLIMLSFLNYMFTNDLSQELKDDYEEILKKRELQKENEILAKLRDFHATAEQKEQTINEFLILFEQGYRILEERNDTLTAQAKENEVKHQKEIVELKQEHEDEMNKLKKEQDAIIAEIEQENVSRIADIEKAKQDEMAKFKEESAIELQNYKDQFKDHIAEMEKENAEIKSHYQEQNEKIAQLETEVLNNRAAKGDTSPIDYNSEDAFDRLEKLKEDFDAFFNKAWKEAKKQIRKDIIFKKRKKGKKGEEPEPVIENKPEPVIEPVKEEPKEEPEQTPIVDDVQEPINEEVQDNVNEEIPNEENVSDEPISKEPLDDDVPEEDLNNQESSQEEPQEEPQNDDEVVEQDSPLDEEPVNQEPDSVNEEETNNEKPIDEENKEDVNE